MKRKRFKHHVDILCRMFCGWQLYTDFDTFAELGSGTLEINAMDGTCEYNQSQIKNLSIATTLNLWLVEELNENNIAMSEIDTALLTVQVEVSPPEYGNRFTSFSFHCTSKLVSGVDEYVSEYQDIQQFECK